MKKYKLKKYKKWFLQNAGLSLQSIRENSKSEKNKYYLYAGLAQTKYLFLSLVQFLLKQASKEIYETNVCFISTRSTHYGRICGSLVPTWLGTYNEQDAAFKLKVKYGGEVIWFRPVFDILGYSAWENETSAIGILNIEFLTNLEVYNLIRDLDMYKSLVKEKNRKIFATSADYSDRDIYKWWDTIIDNYLKYKNEIITSDEQIKNKNLVTKYTNQCINEYAKELKNILRAWLQDENSKSTLEIKTTIGTSFERTFKYEK